MSKEANYKIPGATRIGHVHLKVSDLQRFLDFYCGGIVLGPAQRRMAPKAG